MKKIFIVLLAFVLAGCVTDTQKGGLLTTPPVFQIPIGQAALLYADAKTALTVYIIRIGDLCRAKKLTAEDCAYFGTQLALARQVDVDIRKSILEAKGELDMDKVLKLLEIIASLAGKAL